MISVVIATRDRATLLASTLDALSRQEWPGCPFEILVVDNASADETPAVVEQARRTGLGIVYLREARPGKSHALNTAIAHASGELLVLTDDDVLPGQNWLAAYVRAFAETGADFAAGRILPLWEASPPRWLSPALYGVLAVPDGGPCRLPVAKGLHEHIMPLGANMAVHRRVIERIGGWNPELGKLQGTLRTGEDHEFALRMLRAGFVGVYEPSASVLHRVPADRLRYAYFHRWFYDNGTIEAVLEQHYPTTSHYVLHVPRHLWRQFFEDLAATARGVLTWNISRAVAGELRLAWFVGYLRGRWKRDAGGLAPPVEQAPEKLLS